MAIIKCKDVPLKSFALLFNAGLGRKHMELGSLLKDGNIKLPKTTAIFNLSSAHNCPSMKLGLCKALLQGAKCYALKAENKMRKGVEPYRNRQEAFWHKVTAKEFVSQFILINSTKVIPYTAIRFNEAGDFHNQSCVNKAEEIALLLRRFGIRCYCYTSRSDLDYSKCRNLIVSGSGFVKAGITNEFKIIGKKDKVPKGYGLCVGNCKICRRCLIRNLKTAIRKH